MGFVRLFLAFTVVISHNGVVNTYVGGGGLAVLFFFIISGFCMALVLNGKYTETNPARFYAARFLKLWPPFFVVVCLVFIFIKPVPDFSVTPWAYVPTFLLIGHDVLWWFSPTGAPISSIVAPNLATTTGMQQMWSVGVELSFYLVAPFFARRMSTAIMLLVIAFLTHATLTLELPPLNPQVAHGAVNNLWLFSLGVVMYWSWRRFAGRFDRVKINGLALSVVAVILTALLANLRNTSFLPIPAFRNDFSLAIFSLLIVPLFHFTRHSKIDRMIGEMSYPLYVVHFPIVGYLITAHRADPLWTAILCAISLVGAALLHLTVVRPVDHWRSRLAQGRPLSNLATAASARGARLAIETNHRTISS